MRKIFAVNAVCTPELVQFCASIFPNLAEVVGYHATHVFQHEVAQELIHVCYFCDKSLAVERIAGRLKEGDPVLSSFYSGFSKTSRPEHYDNMWS